MSVDGRLQLAEFCFLLISIQVHNPSCGPSSIQKQGQTYLQIFAIWICCQFAVYLSMQYADVNHP